MESKNLLQQADKFMKMLDDMHENNPEEYKDYINKVIKEGHSQFKPAEFRLSIHAKRRGTNEKHYINICSYSAVPAPKSDNDPVSVLAGSKINEVLNNESIEVDFLGISPKVLDEVGNDKSLQKLVVKLAIDYYNDTNHYNLSYDCGVSKKIVGKDINVVLAFAPKPKKEDKTAESEPFNMNDIKLPFQECADESATLPDIIIAPKSEPRKTSLIHELSSSETSTITFDTEILSDPKNCVRLKAKIDFVDSLNDIELEIIDDEIVITTDGYSVSKCKIPMFEEINESSVKAKFSKSKVLSVTFDMKNVSVR